MAFALGGALWTAAVDAIRARNARKHAALRAARRRAVHRRTGHRAELGTRAGRPVVVPASRRDYPDWWQG
ncbi:hypothetical protein ACFQNE_01915 [Gordonia phosphorivorans]